MKQLLFTMLCVAPLWSGPYTDNNDGTVTDTGTNLRWQKCINGLSGTLCGTGTASSLTWVNAIAYCQGLNLASKTWRLPSKIELLSIVDRSKTGPAIDVTAFPGTVSGDYWSSSTYVSNVLNAWFVTFAYGYSGNGHPKTNTMYPRCVTSGP